MEWKIIQLDCYPEHNGVKDVVVTVHWRIFNGVVGDIPVSTFGFQSVLLTATDQFIPLEDLTETQVLDWIWAAMGPEKKAQLEAAAEQERLNMAAPPVVKPPLPWA